MNCKLYLYHLCINSEYLIKCAGEERHLVVPLLVPTQRFRYKKQRKRLETSEGKFKQISAEVNQNDLEKEWFVFFVLFYTNFVLLPWLVEVILEVILVLQLLILLCVTSSILLTMDINYFGIYFLIQQIFECQLCTRHYAKHQGGACRLLNK